MEIPMTNREPSSRQSIWSVASGWLPAYFILFDALGTIGVTYVIVYNVFGRSHPTVHDMLWTIATGIVIVGAASATVSILMVELGKNIMIVGTYLEDMLNRRRARQLAEAEERVRAEIRAEIREWNARRLEAEAKGEPFDEPPPWLDG